LKIGITVDSETLKRLDRLEESRVFPNRSCAIQEALLEKLMRLEKWTPWGQTFTFAFSLRENIKDKRQTP